MEKRHHVPLFSNLCARGVSTGKSILRTCGMDRRRLVSPWIYSRLRSCRTAKQQQQQQRKTSYRGFKLSANIAVRKQKVAFPILFLVVSFTWLQLSRVGRASIKHHFGWPPTPIRRKVLKRWRETHKTPTQTNRNGETFLAWRNIVIIIL